MTIVSHLSSFTSVQFNSQTDVKVQFDPLVLIPFIRADLAGMNVVCDRAGMIEDRDYALTKAVFDYFALPFDAPAS